jgi:rubredoxin
MDLEPHMQCKSLGASRLAPQLETNMKNTKARFSVLNDMYECPSCGAEPYTYACGALACRCSVCGWAGEYDRGAAVEVDIPNLPRFAIRELEACRGLSLAAMAAIQAAGDQML